MLVLCAASLMLRFSGMYSSKRVRMNNLPSVFFSNRIEILFQKLKQDLFEQSHPLTKRIVIVPSPAIKSWLMFQMAKDPDLGVAAGVEIGFVDPMISRLFALFAPDRYKISREFHEPTELELCLALDQEIQEIIATFDSLPTVQQTALRPLLEYLNVPIGKQASISKKGSKRIVALAATLAKLFYDYGLYGGRMIDTWEFSDWQQQLWKSMEKLFSVWNYPYRKLGAFEIETIPDTGDLQVHIFGLSYIAQLHYRFFMKIGNYIPLNCYLISPCQKFWSDILSDREGERLKAYWRKNDAPLAQQTALEECLRDTNPLLANFGRLGREMALQIEESSIISTEKYALSLGMLECDSYEDLVDDSCIYLDSSTSFSMLEAIQADLALLRNPEEAKKVAFDKYDGTIQIHAAPKQMREVQVIYDVLMRILDKHKQDEMPITPADVIVMSPNIGDYVPFIKTVFGASDSQIDFQIMDLQMPAQNTFIQGFLHLLQLPFGRWDAASLLRLFEYSPFQARHRLTQEDVQVFRSWIKISGIRWGKDYHHRNELLKRDHCSRKMVEDCSNGTWEGGLGRLLEGLAMFSDERQMVGIEGSFAPLDCIDSTQGELLGRILQLLRSLLEDLRLLNDNSKMTLADWSTYLKCICEAYFSIGNEKSELEGYQMLMHQIDTFNKAMTSLGIGTFTFNSIHGYLVRALQKQTVTHRESHLHATRFCSLLPMRAIPAKVVVLIGLQDGAFPRADEQLSLNYLLKNPEADYYPSQVDFDRYLFMESLLSARKYFVLSYVTQALGEVKEQVPSLLVTELLAYLDKAYQIPEGKVSQQCFFKHPFLAFDKRYFATDVFLKSYSKSHYAAALAYYSHEKQLEHNFLPSFGPYSSAQDIHSDKTVELNEEVVIEMEELVAFARNPIRTYFNKALGIYLEKEEHRIIKCDEELQISNLDAVLLSREELRIPVEKVLAAAEKVGRLPRGPFKEMGSEKVMQEAETLKANLRLHGVSYEQIFTIEFSDRFFEPTLVGTCWQMPSLRIETPYSQKVKVIGKFDTVSMNGLIVFGDDEIKEAIKIWPMLLIFCCLINAYRLPISAALIFAKSKKGKPKLANFEDPWCLLGNYLDYYFKGKMFASPLHPEWVAPILSGTAENLQQAFQKKSEDHFQPVYDDYLKWLQRNSSRIDASSTFQHWQATAQDLFIDLNTSWYPKKENREVENEVV